MKFGVRKVFLPGCKYDSRVYKGRICTRRLMVIHGLSYRKPFSRGHPFSAARPPNRSRSFQSEKQGSRAQSRNRSMKIYPASSQKTTITHQKRITHVRNSTRSPFTFLQDLITQLKGYWSK